MQSKTITTRSSTRCRHCSSQRFWRARVSTSSSFGAQDVMTCRYILGSSGAKDVMTCRYKLLLMCKGRYDMQVRDQALVPRTLSGVGTSSWSGEKDVVRYQCVLAEAFNENVCFECCEIQVQECRALQGSSLGSMLNSGNGDQGRVRKSFLHVQHASNVQISHFCTSSTPVIFKSVISARPTRLRYSNRSFLHVQHACTIQVSR